MLLVGNVPVGLGATYSPFFRLISIIYRLFIYQISVLSISLESGKTP